MAEKIDLKSAIFDNFRNFKSSMAVTLTLDQVKVTSVCTIHTGLPAYSTMRL